MVNKNRIKSKSKNKGKGKGLTLVSVEPVAHRTRSRKRTEADKCVICGGYILPKDLDKTTCKLHNNHFHKKCIDKHCITMEDTYRNKKCDCPLCREVIKDENKRIIVKDFHKLVKYLEDFELGSITIKNILNIQQHIEAELINNIKALSFIDKFKKNFDLFKRYCRNINHLYQNRTQAIYDLLKDPKISYITAENYVNRMISHILEFITSVYRAIDKAKALDKAKKQNLTRRALLSNSLSRSKKSKTNKSAP